MRCFLILTIALALVPLYARPTRGQQCDNALPPESDFPEAASTCKNKLKLAPWLGMPHEVFTLSGRCVLSVTLCGGERKCYRSEIRDQKDDWCKDFSAKYDWLANRTICCDPKCEKSAPWLDGLMVDPTKCKNRQRIQMVDEGRFVFLKMCGAAVFVHDTKKLDWRSAETYTSDLWRHVTSKIGTTVCCDSFNKSVGAGSSCDPRTDVDCDGISNGMDVTEDGRFPDLTTFAIGPGISTKDSDPLPACFWPPDPSRCDCKWELIQGIRSLNPRDRREYLYDGSWRCPSTGKEILTRRPAFGNYPCGPGQERKSSIFFIPDDQRIRDVWAEAPQVFSRSSCAASVLKDP